MARRWFIVGMVMCVAIGLAADAAVAKPGKKSFCQAAARLEARGLDDLADTSGGLFLAFPSRDRDKLAKQAPASLSNDFDAIDGKKKKAAAAAKRINEFLSEKCDVTALKVSGKFLVIDALSTSTVDAESVAACLEAASVPIATVDTPYLSGVQGIGVQPGGGNISPGSNAAVVFVFDSESAASDAAETLRSLADDVTVVGSVMIGYSPLPSDDLRMTVEGCAAGSG